MTLRVLTYNICRGGTGKEDQLSAVIAAVRPDIVVFQEATTPAVIETLAQTHSIAWNLSRRKSTRCLTTRSVR